MQDIVVCEICGSGSNPDLIANCAQCNASEHCYCTQVLTHVIPKEWYCAGCHEYANGCSKPNQGGQTELQNPWHGCDKMKERETVKLNLSHSNVAHQIDAKSSNKFGNAKVKFISSEEVASLSKERPRSYIASQQRPVHPASPPSVKQTSNMKPISPSRSDMQVQALRRCAAASRDQAKIEGRPDFAMRQRQVRPASPPHVKQLSNVKCISPNRTETQLHTMKRSAATCQDKAKIDDISMKRDTRSGGSMPTIHICRTSELVKVKVDSMFEDEARETKIMKAHKGEINSEIEDGPRETGTLCALDSDTVSKSEMESLNQNRDVLLSIDSSVEYTRRPPPAICWMGCFHVLDAGANLNLGEFEAQFPSKVSSKVYDIVKMIPNNLQLQLLPRMNDWPKSFEISNPVYEDIGLFFFSKEHDG
ncbi:uncharacterized protein C2845_PM01G18160 [Panicum miliaceum]|uniref:AIPP2-like SPOC-like domain-containing protein n=1 Tax=Panicum miliaceum TaxID=4540 RepID=A0A3L6TH87_PANMI|nr:uncharacterized protein C2845_PM01G18160 [Panicum miliaceum]